MRIGEVIGRVTLARAHPSLRPSSLVIVRPLPAEAIMAGSSRRGEELVVMDLLGAGPGSMIGFSEGREAANPFGKEKCPVDAFCACLLDRIDVEPSR
jgi:ethanolamine utilization protein EutN